MRWWSYLPRCQPGLTAACNSSRRLAAVRRLVESRDVLRRLSEPEGSRGVRHRRRVWDRRRDVRAFAGQASRIGFVDIDGARGRALADELRGAGAELRFEACDL